MNSKRIWLMAGCVVLLATARQLPAQTPPAEPGQRAMVVEQQVKVKYDILLYLPEAYAKDTQAKFPLILFLHGAGERGSDVQKVKVHGPPKIVQNKKDFPFIVVSPQCPENGWWEPFKLNMLLDYIMANYRVDADRVYLTGLSMGGFGTWDFVTRYPERFAAIAPICGAGNPGMVRRIKDMPTWVFHGDKDPTVPVARGDEMVDALKKANAPEVKYTRYEGVGHDSWTATYDNPELYTWFLAHKRSDRKPAK